MSSNTKLIFIGICFLAAAFTIQAADHQHHQQQQQQNHLQCWHCSSDTFGSEDFCGSVFHENSIPNEYIKERNISILRTCNSTINSEHERAVCRKTIEESNGKVVTKRFCYYTNKSDPLDYCNVSSTMKNVRRIFCEDCLSDKCNSATQLAAMLGAMLLPLIIAKVFAI